MADNRLKLKSKNVDDYIQNVDEKVLKEKGKPFLYAMGGLIALGIATVGIGFAIANKKPVKTYEELAGTKTQEVSVKEEKPAAENTQSGGLLLDKITGKKAQTSDNTEEVNRDIPIYLSEPSEDICSADPLSGSVQIGEYLFTLPCKLTAFTDSGFEVIGWGEQSTSSDFSLDAVMPANRGVSILIKYDDYSVYEAFIYDTEDVNLIDSTVVSLSQSKSAKYFTTQAQPLFVPGGFHIGSANEDVDAYFSQFENYVVSDSAGSRVLNGPISPSFTDNNLIYMSGDGGLGELYYVRVYKNY